MKPVANLVIEMAANVARLEKDMAAARRSVDSAMQKIQRSAQMAMRALGALGLGLGVAQLNSFVKQAINAGDRMQKLSQQIGIATENIAGLQLAFRQGGVGAGDLEMAMAKLNTGMSKQTDVYKKLGIQSKDTFGALMEIADIIQQMPDGMQKSSLASELFGRSVGGRLIPVLNQGSEGLKNYLKLSQQLGMVVTSEVGKQFEVFNDTLDTVSGAMEGLANQAAIALIPTLQSLADALLSAFTSGSVQRGVEMLIEAMKLLGIAIAGKLIASIAGMTAGLIKLAVALNAGTAAVAGLSASFVGLNKAMGLLGGSVGLIATAAGALVYFTEKAYRAETTAEGLAEKLGMTNAELRGMTRIQIEQKIVEVASELQKLEVQAIETAAAMALMNEQVNDPEAYSFAGGELSSELGTTNKKVAAFQELLETLKNRLVDTTSASTDAADALSSVGGSADDVEDKVRKLIRAYTDETATMTMSNREKEYFLFLNQMEAEGIKGNTELWHQLAAAYREAQAQRTSTEAVIAAQEADKKRLEERLEAEKEFAKEADQINNQIGQSLTDALVEGGVSAKEFLIKMFRTLVLRPLIQPIISGVLGMMGVGTAGAALAGGVDAGGTMSQAMGMAGVVSTLKGAVDMVSGGFAALGTSVSNLAVDAGFELMSMGFQDAGFAMIDASAALGATATVMAGVAAGLTAGTFISGGYKVGGDQMVSTGLGTAAGLGIAALAGFGPAGLAIGALLGGTGGGLINRAFGMGATTTEAVGIQGVMTPEEVLARQFTTTKQKGGWFRGDKVRTAYEALESDLADRLSMTARSIGQTVIGMADSLGISADRIQGFNRGFTLDFKGMSEEEINQRIEQEFGFFADALAETIEPALWNFKRGTETASQILTRLSGVLTTVNQSFDILGFTLYETSLAGADAAQKMIDLFGGIENFTAATSFYYENFYTEQERANKQLEQMTNLFSAMGLHLPETNQQFRAMVEAAQASGNQALLASLIQLAPAFHSLTNAMEQANAEIARQRSQLVGQIYQILGDTTSIRAQELSELDQSNRGLQNYIYAIEDAAAAQQAANNAVAEATAALNNAVSAEIASIEQQINTNLTNALESLQDKFGALTDQINAQITTLQAQRTVANEALQNLTSIFSFLQGQIEDIFGLIRPAQTAAEGALFVTRALEAAQRTGYLPDPDQLRSAVTAARSGLGEESFASGLEMRRANLQFANELIQLQEIAAGQASNAEEQVQSADEQIELLRRRLEQAQQQYDEQVSSTRMFYDAQLEAERNQLNALLGINGGIQSVSSAIRGLAAAIDAQGAANAALLEAQRQAAEAAAKVTNMPTLTSRQTEIGSYYQSLLGRSATTSEIGYWESTGMSLGDIRSSIVNSQERIQFEIKKAYDQILGRPADAAGLAYWTEQVMSKAITLSGVRESLNRSIRGFAEGGFASPGMAIVGERGPELVDFQRPAQVYTNSELRSAMGGGDTSTEIRGLREENRAQSRALVSLQARMTRLLERWDGDGLPEERVVTA